MSVKIIEALTFPAHHEFMNSADTNQVLVLGATGKTDLASRGSLTSTVIRPAWFMEDFSETFLQPANDEIVVPAGDGAEAFVSVEDIAAVATAPARTATSSR
jgi:hypothetical protein